MLYRRLPLFAKILIGAVLGSGVGIGLGQRAEALKPVSDLVLQALTLLATPLIFLSLVHALVTAEFRGRMAGKLLWVLMSNTFVAGAIGLLVGVAIVPGGHFRPVDRGWDPIPNDPFDPIHDLLGKVPADFLSPFATNNFIGVILIGLALGLALRSLRSGVHASRIEGLAGDANLGLDVVLRLLHWTFELVPFAVLAVVARIVGTTGAPSLIHLGRFAGTVVVGLVLLAAFYAGRLRLSSRVRPLAFLRGGSAAFGLAFSTASSAATLPVTFACATEKLELRPESASLGILVGGTFNHDGGALYQAVSAVFVSQLFGRPLAIDQLGVVLFMSMVASVCTAGIPHAGLVTMIAVFKAVHLPVEYVPFLLPVDWLLDRCRTTINVAGDLAATCIIDR
jgi:DAACS family dicarboxylate/amino acid:cation (Na+ or H+) symporter